MKIHKYAILVLLISLAIVSIVSIGYTSVSASNDSAENLDAYNIYLPLVLKHWPPIPSAPVLNPISNSDGDGNYIVDWDDEELADLYILEESTSANFSGATIVYQGAGTSYTVSDKPVGTYYYRVKATNTWGSSSWSNIQSVTVETAPKHFSGSSPTVSFDVIGDQVCNFDIRVPFSTGYCRIRPPCMEITDDNFGYSASQTGAIFDINGTFDSSTHAEGDYSVSWCGNTLIFPAEEGTWEASETSQ